MMIRIGRTVVLAVAVMLGLAQIAAATRTAIITNPAPPSAPSVAQVFKPGAIIQIDGTAAASNPGLWLYGLNYTFGYYTTDPPPTYPYYGWQAGGMTRENNGMQPVVGGRLGTWQASASGIN